MSRSQLFFLPCFVVGGMLWAPAHYASAQAPDGTGIVRVSDQPIQGDAHQGGPIESGPACQTEGGYGDYVYTNGGYCPDGNCPPHYDYVHHGHCSRKLHQILDWFNPHGMCTFSPDHGWAPPGKQPIYRQPVAYQKGFPDSWTGANGGATQARYRAPVYMPTDTTQLGYYYQQVPQWYPRAGMIPPRPHPAEWHQPACQTGTCGHCRSCQAGHGVQGEIIYEGAMPQGEIIHEGAMPTDIPANPAGAGEYPTVPPQPVDAPGINPAVPTDTTPGLEKAPGTPDLQPIE